LIRFSGFDLPFARKSHFSHRRGGWPQFRHIGELDLELGSYFDFAFDLGVPHVRPAQRANVGIFARFLTICSCFPLVLVFPLPHHT